MDLWVGSPILLGIVLIGNFSIISSANIVILCNPLNYSYSFASFGAVRTVIRALSDPVALFCHICAVVAAPFGFFLPCWLFLGFFPGFFPSHLASCARFCRDFYFFDRCRARDVFVPIYLLTIQYQAWRCSAQDHIFPPPSAPDLSGL